MNAPVVADLHLHSHHSDGVLAPAERQRLARWTASRVIAAAGEAPVFVVCDDAAQTIKDGQPVEMAYLFANRKRGAVEFPDFISGWSDERGYFTFYVPRGRITWALRPLSPPCRRA